MSLIPAWNGFFVNIKKSGVWALFRYREAIGGADAVASASVIGGSEPLWSLSLMLKGEGLVDDGNYLGVRPDARMGEDRYDLSDPPPAPDGVHLSFRLPEGDPRPRRCDYRPPLADGAVWDVRISKAIDRRLAVSGIDDLPPGLSATLFLDVGTTISLAEDVEIELPDDVASARLFVGSVEYLNSEIEQVLPTEYELYPNVPNPFNPETRIRFALPASSPVRLSVYNVLGQEVRVLADREYPPGVHDVTWSGRDQHGRSLSSGVYFVCLGAGDRTITQKVLMLR